jgi:hypothetical protein
MGIETRIVGEKRAGLDSDELLTINDRFKKTADLIADYARDGSTSCIEENIEPIYSTTSRVRQVGVINTLHGRTIDVGLQLGYSYWEQPEHAPLGSINCLNQEVKRLSAEVICSPHADPNGTAGETSHDEDAEQSRVLPLATVLNHVLDLPALPGDPSNPSCERILELIEGAETNMTSLEWSVALFEQADDEDFEIPEIKIDTADESVDEVTDPSPEEPITNLEQWLRLVVYPAVVEDESQHPDN